MKGVALTTDGERDRLAVAPLRTPEAFSAPFPFSLPLWFPVGPLAQWVPPPVTVLVSCGTPPAGRKVLPPVLLEGIKGAASA